MRPVSGSTASCPPGESTFEFLAAEIKYRIADYLPPDAQHAVACTSRISRSQMHGYSLGCIAARRAERAAGFEAFRAVLGDAATEASDTALPTVASLAWRHKEPPLLALSRRIPCLPHHRQAEARSLWLRAVRSRPPMLACPGLQEECTQLERSRQLADSVEHVGNIGQFRAVLAEVKTLPPHHRIMPLATLASRIENRLDFQTEAPAAIADILVAIRQLEECRPALARLEMECRMEPENAAELSSLAFDYLVRTGEPVADAARRGGIDSEPWIGVAQTLADAAQLRSAEYTESVALLLAAAGIEVIESDLEFGEPAREIAARYRITPDDGRYADFVGHAYNEARTAVTFGHEPFSQVLQRYDITHKDDIAELEIDALAEAHHAALLGAEPLQALFRKHDFMSPQDQAGLRDTAVLAAAKSVADGHFAVERAAGRWGVEPGLIELKIAEIEADAIRNVRQKIGVAVPQWHAPLPAENSESSSESSDDSGLAGYLCSEASIDLALEHLLEEMQGEAAAASQESSAAGATSSGSSVSGSDAASEASDDACRQSC